MIAKTHPTSTNEVNWATAVPQPRAVAQTIGVLPPYPYPYPYPPSLSLLPIPLTRSTP